MPARVCVLAVLWESTASTQEELLGFKNEELPASLILSLAMLYYFACSADFLPYCHSNIVSHNEC